MATISGWKRRLILLFCLLDFLTSVSSAHLPFHPLGPDYYRVSPRRSTRSFHIPDRHWRDRKREQHNPRQKTSLGSYLTSEEKAQPQPGPQISELGLNPYELEPYSPAWNMAMIQFLKSLRKNGYKMVEKPASDLVGDGENQIVCKMEPFNICYEVDSNGGMHAVGDRRPIRMMRVYRRKKRK